MATTKQSALPKKGVLLTPWDSLLVIGLEGAASPPTVVMGLAAEGLVGLVRT